MKKENIVKRILVNSLIGVPVGSLLLMIAYIGVYYLADNNTFIKEMSQLQNINTLLLQIIIYGFSYYLFFVLFNIATYLDYMEHKEKYQTNHPYKTIWIVMLSCTAMFAANTFLLTNCIFSSTMIKMNIVVFLLLWFSFSMISPIIFLIKRNHSK